MRFGRLSTRGFGSLGDATFELDRRAVVVLGPNEAGKSTFLAALETVLYGFEPATRDTHPLANWSEGPRQDLTLVAQLELASGSRLAVERVLQSRGRSRRAEGGAALDGPRQGNTPLQEVARVPRSLFRGVYALTSRDLVELEGDVRLAVDELLLGERAVGGMRPLHAVRAEIAAEQRQLWRPSRRGKPRSRVLEAEMHEAREALRAARSKEAELREALAEKGAIDARLRELARERERLLEAERRAAFAREVEGVERRRAALGTLDLAPLEGLTPRDPEPLRRDVRALEVRLLAPPAAGAPPSRDDRRDAGERSAIAPWLVAPGLAALVLVLAAWLGPLDGRVALLAAPLFALAAVLAARATARRAERRRARAERERAEREARAGLEARLEVRRGELERLERFLAANAGAKGGATADPAGAWARIAARLDEERYLAGRTAELRRDPRWSTFETASTGETGGSPAASPDGIAASLARVEERAEAEQRRLGELRERVRAADEAGVARAEERIADLRAEFQSLRRDHDRLALADALLAEADRSWREENQPDVLRRASAYLERITTGRYTRLDYPDGQPTTLAVTCVERSEPVPVAHPISRGTRDQIYLCLRLGLLDHLDEDRERLPLILDEALVHWDRERRAELWPLLADVGTARQVVLLTCHEALAAEAAEALGARPIELSSRALARPTLG